MSIGGKARRFQGVDGARFVAEAGRYTNSRIAVRVTSSTPVSRAASSARPWSCMPSGVSGLELDLLLAPTLKSHPGWIKLFSQDEFRDTG